METPSRPESPLPAGLLVLPLADETFNQSDHPISLSKVSSIVTSSDSEDDDLVEDTAPKVVQAIADCKDHNVWHNMLVVKRIYNIFDRERLGRDNEIRDEAYLVDAVTRTAFESDDRELDRISTESIPIYNSLMRQRIRAVNQRHSTIMKSFSMIDKSLISWVNLLLDRKSTGSDSEDTQLQYFQSILRLVLMCFEFGYFEPSNIRVLIKLLFLSTEQLYKIEQHMMQNNDHYSEEAFETALLCKTMGSQILFHIITVVNDNWLFNELKTKGEIEIEAHSQALNKNLIESSAKGQSRKSFLIKPQSIQLKKKICCKKSQRHTDLEISHQIFFIDSQYYSLFSFMMFNYLLSELRRSDRLVTSDEHKDAMHQLLLYVFDYREDAFMASLQLLKPEYLAFYLEDGIDAEYMARCSQLVKALLALLDKFDGQKVQILNMESSISVIFSELEMLLGIQEDSCSLRLMLTENKVPVFLVELFVNMQECLSKDPCDELFLQGIKVLYELCKDNYPGQAQITTGTGWEKFTVLLQGNFAVFSILLLKQLFEEEEDCRFIHLNTSFSIDLLGLLQDSVEGFLSKFNYESIQSSATDLVLLYNFQMVIRLFLTTNNIEPYLKQNFDFLIMEALHRAVNEFAIPLFRDNRMAIETRYQPKLAKKNWKLEDGSFLVSLMLLTGDHIKSMVVDFAYSILSIYNLASGKCIPGGFYEDIKTSLPLDTSCYDYLFKMTEGLKFKTEILVSYSIFSVFSKAQKLNETYTAEELSMYVSDTNKEFVPEDHIGDLPKLIIREMEAFETISDRQLSKQDVMEYLLRGISQLTLKYIHGLIWHLNAIDNEESTSVLYRHLHEMNQRFHNLRMVVSRLKKSTTFRKSLSKLSRFGNPFNDPDHVLLSSSISSLLQNIYDMIDETEYSWLRDFYKINNKYMTLKKMPLANDLLKTESRYIDYCKFQNFNILLTEKSTKPLDPLNLPSIANYVKIKLYFFENPNTNMFFKILTSKMGNINQKNLVGFLANLLSEMDSHVTSRNSIWVSKKLLQLLIILTNTLHWCPNARIKLYEYLEQYPTVRDNILTVVYKGVRNSFTMLAYSPYCNLPWQYVFSRFFIFSSFLNVLCKHNCQDFKEALGAIQLNLQCQNHRKMKHTILTDLMSVMVKYLQSTGVSSNKSPLEKNSDKLSNMLVVELGLRCITDMITGPCKQNQIQVYMLGNQIWIQMFRRLLIDLRSNYYRLMDITLDYLVSLIEGTNHKIMDHFSANLDAPVLFTFTVNLMTLLFKRINFKRKEKIVQNIVHPLNNSTLTKSKVSQSVYRPALREIQVEFERQIFTKKRRDTSGKDMKKDEVHSFLDYSKENNIKLNNWQSLIKMYKNGDLSTHVTLHCCIKIFIFLSRVSKSSKKYQIFFDKKEKDLHDMYIKAGFKEEEIKNNKIELKGLVSGAEDLIVYYFMKNITAKVEIRDNHSASEIFIFPKPPCCFFLKDTTKKDFVDTCQIDNTEAKMVDMFESFEQFKLEMISNQKFKRNNRFLGYLASEHGFSFFRKLCYFTSLIINIMMLLDVDLIDHKVKFNFGYYPILGLSIFLIFTSCTIFALWLISNFSASWQLAVKDFRSRYQYKNPLMPRNLISILGNILLRREVINFYLHALIAGLALIWSPVAHAFHLILIINISSTTKYVLKAVLEHRDQLLATVYLVTIIIYTFSILVGLWLGNNFIPEGVRGLPICRSLWSCYLQILNLGLTRGGGISEAINVTDIDSESVNFYLNLILILGFFIMVNIICLNVIFGIIIDTFSELRDKQNLRDWDQLNRCDICGIERKIFEKRGLNFDIHQSVQHNLWDYVFYLVYLQTLDEQSLTGFEYFVFSQFKNRSTAWLPISSTLFLKDTRDEDQLQLNLIDKKLTDFKTEVNMLIDSRFDELIGMMGVVTRKVDRALQTLSDTRDCLQGKTANEDDGLSSRNIKIETIKLINID